MNRKSYATAARRAFTRRPAVIEHGRGDGRLSVDFRRHEAMGRTDAWTLE